MLTLTCKCGATVSIVNGIDMENLLDETSFQIETKANGNVEIICNACSTVTTFIDPESY